jgi:hypothetical protein
MKLDRNLSDNGRGKYALLLLRRLQNFEAGTFGELAPQIASAIETLDKAGLLDWGITGTESEFFVTRLKDRYAAPSLYAYANAAAGEDPEWAAEVSALARVAEASPWQQRPD